MIKGRPLCMVCMVFLLARYLTIVIWGEGAVKELRPSMAEQYMTDSEQVTVSGEVYQKDQNEKHQILYLKNNSISNRSVLIKESKIIIYDNTFENIAVGDTITASGKLYFFETARNPGNFDSRFYYQIQDIHSSVSAKEVSVSQKGKIQLQERLWQLKQSWSKLLIEHMGEETGTVLSAMLLGVKTGMDSDLKSLYQKTGIGHLIAISALHVSIIGMGFYHLLRKTGMPYLLSGSASVLLLLSYMCMVGPGVSILRAVIMLVFQITADLAGESYDSLTALAFSAAVAVIWRPLSYFDAAFLLSYGSVLGILLIRPVLVQLFPLKNKVLKSLLPGLSVQIAIFPITLYFYYEFPLYSFFLNLIVIPAMEWVLTLGILGSMTAMISGMAGAVILKGSSVILKLYEFLGEYCLALPYARIVTGKPEKWKILVYYIGVFFVCVWIYRLKKKRAVEDAETNLVCKRRYPILITAALALFCMIRLPEKGLRVTMIDVGQGDGFLLQMPDGTNCLVDGGSSDVKQVGKYRMEPFLECVGVGVIDYVFVSHGDGDHCSGIEELLERQNIGVRIGSIVFPYKWEQDERLCSIAGKAREYGVRIAEFTAEERMTFGEAALDCLQPGEDFQGEKGNESSMVMKLSYDRFSMLFTGDTEGSGEKGLTANERLTHCTILKTAHHGSRNSSGEAFLQRVRPEIALISAGIENSYGHPHRETVDRFLSAGAKCYSTQDNGAITVKTDGNRWTVNERACNR